MFVFKHNFTYLYRFIKKNLLGRLNNETFERKKHQQIYGKFYVLWMLADILNTKEYAYFIIPNKGNICLVHISLSCLLPLTFLLRRLQGTNFSMELK